MECMQNGFVQGELLDGRYRTVSPLNHGSFGMVFKAIDTWTSEPVAIKCLTKPGVVNACPNDMAVDDLSEELSIHRKIGSHPNIVNLLHSFETESHIYLVLEFCSNGDLYEAIRVGRGPLETEHVRSFMLQLVSAIKYLHARGIYHRDIKPENIFLCQDGSMKLGDFGLATLDDCSFEAAVGSDRYMAPEQYDPPSTGYDPAKADVWSIGICLLNVLFSRNPFATPTYSDPLFADFAKDRQSIFDVFPNMSQDTFEILTHALSLDPTRRSLDAVEDSLRAALTFTTDDEILDEFCIDENVGLAATAYREPLRTPSIASPQVETNGPFPWAKALAMNPQHLARRLSAISNSDDDDDDDDLFDTSRVNDKSECDSVATSFVDSGLGASVNSLSTPFSRSSPLDVPGMASASLPSGGLTFSSMYSANQPLSKSWSDLWDEEEEEEEEKVANVVAPINLVDSNPAVSSNVTPVESTALTLEMQSKLSFHELADSHDMYEDNDGTATPIGRKQESVCEDTGFIFEDCNSTPTPKHVKPVSIPKPKNSIADEDSGISNNSQDWEVHGAPNARSPPTGKSRKEVLDKWAALGDKRRGQTAHGKRNQRKAEENGKSVPRPRAHSFKRPATHHGVHTFEATHEKDNKKEWENSKDWRQHTPEHPMARVCNISVQVNNHNTPPVRHEETKQLSKGFFGLGSGSGFVNIAGSLGFGHWASSAKPSSSIDSANAYSAYGLKSTRSTKSGSIFQRTRDHRREATGRKGMPKDPLNMGLSWVCRDQDKPSPYKGHPFGAHRL